jgi:recombination protein RecT
MKKRFSSVSVARISNLFSGYSGKGGRMVIQSTFGAHSVTTGLPIPSMGSLPNFYGGKKMSNLEIYKNILIKEESRIKPLLRQTSYEGLVETILLLIAENEDLQRCTPESIVSSLIEAVQFTIPNEVHLVPFKSRAVLIPGYKGLLKMAQRDPELISIDARPVYSKEIFDVVLGTERQITHIPIPFGDKGTLLGFYAYAKFKNGDLKIQTLSVEEAKEHMVRFMRPTKGPFADPKNFESYGRKTVLRLLCLRDLNLHAEMARLIKREFIEGEEAKDVVDVGFSEISTQRSDSSIHNPQPEGRKHPAEGNFRNGKRRLVEAFIEHKGFDESRVQDLIREFSNGERSDLEQLSAEELSKFYDYIRKI